MSDYSPTNVRARNRSWRTAILVFAFVFLGGVSVIAAWAGSAAPAAPTATPAEEARDTNLDLHRLLASFSEMPGFEARFEENKTLALLAVPLRSEGRIFYSPSANAPRLLRRIELPNAQDVLISENAIRIHEAGREEVIDLNARAEIRPLVESLLWVFSGDREALEAAFVVKFVVDFIADVEASASDRVASQAGRDRWRLLLLPRNASLKLLIERLEISGAGLGADRIAIFESGGDRAVMRVFDANPKRHFTEAEELRLFGRGPRSPTVNDD